MKPHDSQLWIIACVHQKRCVFDKQLKKYIKATLSAIHHRCVQNHTIEKVTLYAIHQGCGIICIFSNGSNVSLHTIHHRCDYTHAILKLL